MSNDVVSKMWEILTTLTEESQAAALAKCTELKFDPNRGDVPLEESFINMSTARHILVDAIENKKLIQLPLSIQKSLLSYLEQVSNYQAALINGADQVINLVNAIESLNAAMWHSRLYNLSDEVLGYQTKMNQLKTQELELNKLRKELQKGLELKGELNKLRDESDNLVKKIEEDEKLAEEKSVSITGCLTQTSEASQKAVALLATIQQYDDSSAKFLAAAKQSNAEISALEPKIREFYSEIDINRTKIMTMEEDAQKAVHADKVATEELISQLRELEGKIKTQIEKATGYSLFHSFQTRQERLAKSKRYWAGILAALVLASIGLTFYVVATTDNFNVAFYLKLALSIPIIYAIAFCTMQYSRERKLEEEYAFKANISLSLVPYKDLVDKLVDKSVADERSKYTAFIIDSITKVFTSPTALVFESGEKQKGLSNKTLKQVVELIEPLIKGLKH